MIKSNEDESAIFLQIRDLKFEQGQHKWAKYLTRALTSFRLFYNIMFYLDFICNKYIRTKYHVQIFINWSFILHNICTYLTGRIFKPICGHLLKLLRSKISICEPYLTTSTWESAW